MSQIQTIPFRGTCSARAELTLVSPRISRPYTLQSVTVTFTPGTQALMPIRIYIAEDDQAPSSGAPNGLNIFGPVGEVSYLAGDGQQYSHAQEVLVPVAGTFVKVYAANSDWYDHAVDVQITIILADEED